MPQETFSKVFPAQSKYSVSAPVYPQIDNALIQGEIELIYSNKEVKWLAGVMHRVEIQSSKKVCFRDL